MEFHFCRTVKWSDINPLNHAIKNEYVGNLLNLSFAVIGRYSSKPNLKVVNGFVCGKLIDSIQKDSELKSFIKEGRCIGLTYDGYSLDDHVSLALDLKHIGIGTYLTANCFYVVLNSTDVKVRNGSKWNVVDK